MAINIQKPFPGEAAIRYAGAVAALTDTTIGRIEQSLPSLNQTGSGIERLTVGK